MTGFCMKWNTGIKWVNRTPQWHPCKNFSADHVIRKTELPGTLSLRYAENNHFLKCFIHINDPFNF